MKAGRCDRSTMRGSAKAKRLGRGLSKGRHGGNSSCGENLRLQLPQKQRWQGKNWDHELTFKGRRSDGCGSLHWVFRSLKTWKIMKLWNHELSWTFFKSFLNPLELSWTLSNFLEPSWSFLNCAEHSRSAMNNLRRREILRDKSEPGHAAGRQSYNSMMFGKLRKPDDATALQCVAAQRRLGRALSKGRHGGNSSRGENLRCCSSQKSSGGEVKSETMSSR